MPYFALASKPRIQQQPLSLHTTGEPTCADGHDLCRRPNVGAVGTQPSRDRRRVWPSAKVAIHRWPPSAPPWPSAQTTDLWDQVFLRYSALKLCRRPPSAQLRPSAQRANCWAPSSSVTAPLICADGHLRHNIGRQYSIF